MEQQKFRNHKLLSIILIAINILLLIAFLNYGYVTENQSIHNLFICICFVFIMSLSYVLYYRQKYRTVSFWILIVVSGIFVIATLIYLYITNYTYHI